ncbi:MAG: hypothetical protein JNK75_09385 [Betaproteobacteria bacterium]|nr:hypothetical protein [Betaproteobacteria bacterium]
MRPVEYQSRAALAAASARPMLDHLKQLEALRGPQARLRSDTAFAARVLAVKRWQNARLTHWYRDLAAQPRYAPAVAFFLDELYGTQDSALRDRDLIRMEPTMRRLLPDFAFQTVESALELDLISEEFDQALAACLAPGPINGARYAVAFRAAGQKERRLKQVALMGRVGEGLDVVVAKPFIFTTLKMLRGPAKLAGLGEMQRFLEAGFTAFRHMAGAEVFLSTIAERETALIETVFSGASVDFEVASPVL